MRYKHFVIDVSGAIRCAHYKSGILQVRQASTSRWIVEYVNLNGNKELREKRTSDLWLNHEGSIIEVVKAKSNNPALNVVITRFNGDYDLCIIMNEYHPLFNLDLCSGIMGSDVVDTSTFVSKFISKNYESEKFNLSRRAKVSESSEKEKACA